MKRWFTYILSLPIFFITVSNCENKNLIIKPLHPYSWLQTDTVRNGFFVNKIKFFFVDNFEYDDPSHIRQLKSFAYQQLDSDYKKYANYEIHFYRRTNTINENFKDTDDEELAWHSDDKLA